jgi:hypothetical protein
VSSAAIAKANRLLLGEPDSEMKTPAQQRPLFQTTGSGVTLQASVDSMEKVNSLLGGMSDSDASTPHSPPTTTAAFHTAGSGSMIDVSSAAIAKANRLLGCEPDSEMKAPAQQRPTRASKVQAALSHCKLRRPAWPKPIAFSVECQIRKLLPFLRHIQGRRPYLYFKLLGQAL